MSSVTLKNIRKVYPPIPGKKKKGEENSEALQKGVVAVEDFSMEIKDKEFVVLVGPSGCGKSTTLRMIAGLEEITGGELYIGDRLVNELEPKDRDIAMVFQNYALYPHMTVYDNMAFALKKNEIKRKVMEAAEILSITDYLYRKPKNLSGGQRQRVAIGRAIVRNPRVMLMDEPLSNLDAKLRNQMRAELMRLRKRIDTTFIYVTHDQTEAMTLGDRIVVMKDGLVMQIGTPDEVFNSPQNIFVASFIGSPQMNFFDGILRKEGDGFSVSILGKNVSLSEGKSKILEEKGITERKVKIGVRPEEINITGEGSFSGRVGVAEHMGSTIHLHLESEDKEIVAVTEARDQNGLLKSFPVDALVHFSFSSEAMHIFDAESGNNIGL